MRAVLLSVAIGAVSASQYQTEFLDFLQKYQKQYISEELFYRFSVFQENRVAIDKHNSENHTWTLGINQFADLTAAEFEKIYLGYLPRNSERKEASLPAPAPNVEVDWTTKGAVTPVKDQGQCGSCWAFSATGSIEGAWFLSKMALVSVSEQQLVDCSGSSGNQGCNGGLMDNAFQWIVQNGGIAAESDYAYTAKDGTCKKVASTHSISGFKDIPAKNEAALVTAVQTQPIAIAVDARKWQLYASGVFSGCGILIQLDHGVLAAGYSTNGGYWLVKNSWGGSWGEKGYIRLKAGANECGLSNAASYPTA